MKKKSIQSIVASALIVPAAVIGVTALSCKLNISQYTVHAEEITKPIRVVMLSDLHGSMYGENQVDLINAVKNQKPDLIVFAGDILVEDMPHLATVMLLEGIAGICPCYASAGNHELRIEDDNSWKKIFSDYGVTVVGSECLTITVNGQTIDICGLEDMYAGEDEFLRQVDALTDFKPSNYSILLSHHAEFVDIYKTFDFDLIFSGHAHGGQWRIPYVLNGVFAPDQGFFPKYTGGVYEYNNTSHVIGRGLVKFYIIPRVFNRPELVVVDIEPK
jgi:predicted MPP superfamily phosphohydrolase